MMQDKMILFPGNLKVLVLGDLMLDSFVWGKVSRISPEAPTSVLQFEGESYQPGGALFTATVLKQLGVDVDTAGVIGDDANGQLVQKILSECGIRNNGIVLDTTRPTTIKQRLLAKSPHLSSNSQQLLRVDKEDNSPITGDVLKKLLSFLKKHIADYDVIIISDYCKGVLCPEILLELKNKKQSIPVIGDPGKNVDYGTYLGFNALKPNRFEAENFTGITLDSEKNIKLAAEKIIQSANLDFVIISLDQEGLFYLNKNKTSFFSPTIKKDVFDVAGAGDSVIAVTAMLAFNQDNSVPLMLKAANIAAGIMISQKSDKKINIQEINHHLAQDGVENKKIKSADELINIIQNSDQTVYFTNGYFDNINTLQINFLENLGKFDGLKIVAVNSDESIISNNHKPKLKQSDRLKMLKMFDCIDYIILFNDVTVDKLLKKLSPDVFLKGSNYRNQKITEAKTLKDINCSVEFIDS